MAIEDAVKSIKLEAASIAQEIRNGLGDLDFDTSSILSIKQKYNSVSLNVIGQSYDSLLSARSLPVIDPSNEYDRHRLGYDDFVVIGTTALPSASSNNLSVLQKLYLASGESLGTVNTQLQNNPPRESFDNRFSLFLNKSVVRAVSVLKPNGTRKSRDEIAASLDSDSFEYFEFTEHPSIVFAVLYEYLGNDASTSIIARSNGLSKDQVIGKVAWYGGINASTFNFNRMRRFELNEMQIRSAAFGDDYASVSTSYFDGLLDDMEEVLQVAGNQTVVNKVKTQFLSVQAIARTFLAQVDFVTFVVSSNDLLDNLREAGMSDTDIQDSFASRSGVYFQGVNDTANALRTTVFPTQSNTAERRALLKAFAAARNTANFSTTALNEPIDFRKELVTSAKRLLASVESKLISLESNNMTSARLKNLITSLENDVVSLRTAYGTFLSPPSFSRVVGTQTTESSGSMLLRSTDVVESLRIKDEITNFPSDINGNIDANLEILLSSLYSLADTQRIYFNEYRSGPMRDFLAAAISVSSVTNFLLSDGQPDRNKIVEEYPERIGTLSSSIQSEIINDTNSEELFNVVSLQVEQLWSFLSGNENSDPLGRLFDLPILVINAILSDTSNVSLLPQQTASLEQIKSSFEVLRETRASVSRDLTVLRSNFGCAVTDAEYLVARLTGNSLSELVKELGQVDS